MRGSAELLDGFAQEAETGEYQGCDSTVDLNRVAVGELIRLIRPVGIDPGIHEPLLDLLGQRSLDGHGSDGFSSIFEPLRPDRASGPEPASWPEEHG